MGQYGEGEVKENGMKIGEDRGRKMMRKERDEERRRRTEETRERKS